MVQLIAESVGVQARFMTGTEEFFRAVAEWRPTHIAVDLIMPDMDGVEVLQRLADRGCQAKIIITSGVGSRVLDAAGRSANEHGLEIAGVLSKPFSPKHLRELLADGFGQDRRRDEPSLYKSTRTDTADDDSTARDLRRALDQDEIRVVYQPQLDCVSGELAGFEALARWVHPERGLIMPDRFISAAENTGLIDVLTDRVLDIALGWLARQFGGSELTIAVNLSSRSASVEAPAANDSTTPASDAGAAAHSNLVERVVAACRIHDVKPERLILELTETSAMEDPVASLDLLTRLRMKGFQLSIDDFGTGYSSMLQLVRLPFSEIKIDKSFVMTAIRSAESRAVVESIIGLGHSLGLRVVAEGVENEETLQYLRDQGCDLAQGYHIGRPLAGEAIDAWRREDAPKFQHGLMQRPLL